MEVFMNNRIKLFGIIAIVAMIGFSMAACELDHKHTLNVETGLCTECGALMYSLGDTGPGGGTIFYRYEAGFGAHGENWHYLEAAPDNQHTSMIWSGTSENIIEAEQKGIGYGQANTEKIIEVHSNTSPPDTSANNAAMCAAAYRGPKNKSDWFLPSESELEKMRDAKTHVKGIMTGDFWSSTQQSSSAARTVSFSYPMNGGAAKGITGTRPGVRAVRAF